MARRLLWASLVLAPATILVDAVAHPGKVALFVLSAVSLVPLAWLIGEATEHAGEHTGPRIGGLLNASFGNAPEVIIALIAVADNLPNVVRGSLAGSVVSNILLVLGAALVLGMLERGVLRGAPPGTGMRLLRLAAAEPRAYTVADAIALIHVNPEQYTWGTPPGSRRQMLEVPARIGSPFRCEM